MDNIKWRFNCWCLIVHENRLGKQYFLYKTIVDARLNDHEAWFVVLKAV